MECKAGKEYDLWVVHTHSVTAGDKPCRHLLVPDTAINGSLTLAEILYRDMHRRHRTR